MGAFTPLRPTSHCPPGLPTASFLQVWIRGAGEVWQSIF